jgi:predicted ATPase
MLGWPDRALEAGHQAVDLARKLGHPFNLCWALTGGSGALIYRREPEPLIRRANEAIDIARAQCMPVVENVRVPIWQSPALLELGQLEECVHQLRSGLQAWRQIGGNLLAPFCLGVLADALGRMGRVKEALGVIDEGVAEVEARGERCHEAELHRIKGELMFKQGRRLHREAEACFRKSITVALEQNTRSWELRAVTSFARLLADEGKRTEAHDLLEPIYNWFTEGLDTADLKDAKTLLNELS